MSLNLDKLEKVRHRGNGGVEARCPACAEGGHDRKGEHLIIKPDGRFGCCVHPKDREHRKRIFALAGDTSPRSIKVKSPAVKVAGRAVVSGVLGRLGRVFASPAKAETNSDASDGVNEVQSEPDEVRTHRTGSVNSVQDGQPESRTLRTPQYSYTCGEENGDEGVCIEVQGVPVGASVPSVPLPVSVESEQGVRSVRECGALPPAEDWRRRHPNAPIDGDGRPLPYLGRAGRLILPFDSNPRFHYWNGGQELERTMEEVTRGFHATKGKEVHGAGI